MKTSSLSVSEPTDFDSDEEHFSPTELNRACPAFDGGGTCECSEIADELKQDFADVRAAMINDGLRCY